MYLCQFISGPIVEAGADTWKQITSSSCEGHSMRSGPGSSPTLSELALIKVSYSYVMFSKGFGTSGRNSQAFLKNRGNMFRIWLTPDELRICTKVHPGRTAPSRRMPVWHKGYWGTQNTMVISKSA